MLLVFGAAKLLAEVFERLGQPGLAGEILAGVLVGPSVLNWIAPSEAVDDIDQGKDRAAAHAAAYLSRVSKAKLPTLNWQKARSV